MNVSTSNQTKPSRRGGRPPAADPRVIVLSTKVNKEEFGTVMQRMAETGLKRSEALRLLILHEHLPKKIMGGLDITASEAYQRLQPLQSNLNQIAHALNAERLSQIPPQGAQALLALIRKIEKEVKVLRQEVIDKKVEVSA